MAPDSAPCGPGKLVVFQHEPRKKRATHAKFSRTHMLANKVPFLHHQKSAGACWATSWKRAMPPRGAESVCDLARELERDLLGAEQSTEWHDFHES